MGCKCAWMIAAAASAVLAAVPTGWHLAGDQPGQYDCGVDPDVHYQGQHAAYLISKPDIQTTGFGTMMQTFDAAAYMDKRVRFSGYMRSEGFVHGSWASLWVRVDGVNRQNNRPEVLAFDNMHDTGKTDRSLKGTHDWKEYSIVLDVPVGAASISMGLMLAGSGEVWLSGTKFETVGRESKVTGGPRYQ